MRQSRIIRCIYLQGEDGPDIRGGSIDALVVHATAANKTGMYLSTIYLVYDTHLLLS